jgi:transcription initiation factor TFIIE subunit alpha
MATKTKNPKKNARKSAAAAKKSPAKKIKVSVKQTNNKKQLARPTTKQKPTAKLSLKDQAKQVATSLKLKEKEAATRKRTNVSVPQPDAVKAVLETLLHNESAVEYLKKNVSKMAVDVIGMLVTPKTDEFLAEQTGMKINAIRRILNIMQGYGITNYYISKNTKGWLSFAWYINTSKLPPFLEYVNGMEREKSIVNDACNDYFVCEGCYKSDRFVFTFDSAFENNFKCNNCGKNLNRMNREEAEGLISNKTATVLKPT